MVWYLVIIGYLLSVWVSYELVRWCFSKDIFTMEPETGDVIVIFFPVMNMCLALGTYISYLEQKSKLKEKECGRSKAKKFFRL